MRKFTRLWQLMMILLISSSVLVVQAQKNVTSEKAPVKNIELKKETSTSPEEQIKMLEDKGLKGEELAKTIVSTLDEKQLKALEENGITQDLLMNDENALYKTIEYLNVPDNSVVSPVFKPGDTDAVNTYTFSQSTGTYTEITGGTVLGTTTSDDQRFVDPAVPAGGSTTTGVGFPIGFNFTFDGVVFDRLAINNNGWISLGQSALTPAVNNASTSAYTPIGSVVTITPDNLVSRIVGLARDLQGQTGSELRIQTIGTTPNQECVIQWKGYRKYGATGDNYNFQIRLLESGNVIKLVYGTMTNNATAATPQVGLRAAPSATATNFANRTTTTDWSATTAGGTNTATCTLSSTVYPASGLTFIYTPPAAGTPLPPTNPSPADGTTGVAISGNLTWTFGANTVTYDLKYGPTGNMTQVVTGATAGTTGSYPYTANYSTTYQWQVIEHNGALQTDGPVWSFTTVCGAYTLPYSENFDGVTPPVLPLCTSYENTNGDTYYWSTYASAASPPSVPNVLYMRYNASLAMDDWFFTPGFTLNAGTSYTVNFKYTNNSSTYIEKLEVKWGSAANSTAMTFGPIFNNAAIQYNGVWQDGTGSFTPLSSGVYYLGFHGYSDIDQFNLYVDNISFDVTPSCPAPTALTVANITSNSADLGWTETGTAVAWEYQYGLAGFTPAATGTPTTVNPTPISGLSANTSYDFYVRANCGGTYSTWAGPKNFKTACDAYTSLNENFDALTTPAIPDCWAKYISPSWTAQTVTTITTSPYTSPNCVQLYSSGATLPSDAPLLITPYLSNLAAGTHQLRFFAKGASTNISVIVGTMSDPANAATFSAFQTVTGLSTTVWTEYTIYFTSYSGTDDYIAFKHPLTTTYSYIYLDNVIWEPLPSCPPPSLLTATNITPTSADLGWLENGSATAWEYQYGPVGFTPAATGTATTSNPTPVSGLTSSTAYDFYVRANCGGGDFSTWTGPKTFTTALGPVAFPVYEDFEPGFDVFVNQASSTTAWVIDNVLQVSPTNSAKNAYGSTNTNILYLTGTFSLVGLSNPQLSFSQIGCTEGDYDHCYVEISVDGGNTFTPLPVSDYLGTGVYDLPLYNSPAGPCFDEDSYAQWLTNVPDNTYWRDEAFSLASYNTYNYVTIRFRLHSDGSVTKSGWWLDNISISNILCPAPAALTATNITTSTADLGWTSTASAWEYQYGLTGFTPAATGTPTTLNPTPISGLSASTSYDFYVRADCGSGLYSAWAGPKTFTTACAPYVAPYSEDFTTWPPVCWDLTGGTYSWTQYTTGVSCAMANFWSQSGGNTDIMTTNTIDVSGIANPALEFYWSHFYNSTYPNDTLKVLVSDDNGATWNQVWMLGNVNFNSNDGAGNTNPGTFVSSGIIDLAPYGNSILIRFYGKSGFGPNCYVDNVSVFNAAYGTLSGYVYRYGTTTPISGATISFGQYSTVTGIDGSYSKSNVLVGTYTVDCAATGYTGESASGVVITEGNTTVQNFYLKWAEIAANPTLFNETLQPDTQLDKLLTLTNNAPAALNYTTSINFISDNIEKSKAAGDILLDLNIEASTLDVGNLGAEFDGTNYFVSGSNGGVAPFKLYKLSQAGALVTTYDQPTQATTTWGMRDLAYNAGKLYGGSEDGFYEFDIASGTFATKFTGNLGLGCIRALAYYPVSGNFLAVNWSGAITEFTATGTVVTTYAAPSGLTGIYGMAWDSWNSKLWLFDQSGTPFTTFHEYDIATQALTGVSYQVPMLSGLSDQIAGGAFFSITAVPGKAVLGGLVQGTDAAAASQDHLFLMELNVTETWLSITANGSGTVPGTTEGSVNITVHFDATGYTNGTVKTANIIINSNALNAPVVTIPVTMNVISGYRVYGTVYYGVLDTKPQVTQTTVTLTPGSTVNTGAGGAYEITAVLNGAYELSGATTKPWGGLNSPDPTLAQRYILGLQVLTNLQKRAGDVNLTGTIQSVDVTMMKRRLVGQTYPQWIFPNEYVWDGPFIPGWHGATPTWTPILGLPVTVAGGDVQQNLRSICTGDVNYSHTPLPNP